MLFILTAHFTFAALQIGGVFTRPLLQVSDDQIWRITKNGGSNQEFQGNCAIQNGVKLGSILPPCPLKSGSVAVTSTPPTAARPESKGVAIRREISSP